MQNELSVGDLVKIGNYEEEYNGKYAVIKTVPGQQCSYYDVEIVNSARTLLMQRSEIELAKLPPDPECPFPIGSKIKGKVSCRIRTVTGWKQRQGTDGPEWVVTYVTENGINNEDPPEFFDLVTEDPECPFPMGSMVNSAFGKWDKAFEVVGWEMYGDKWTVTLDDSNGSPVRGYDPAYLVLEPDREEPAPGTPILWKGKWYSKPEGRPDYYFSLTDWSWVGNVTWDKMKGTATVPGP